MTHEKPNTPTTTKRDLRLSKRTIAEMGNTHHKTDTTRPKFLTENEAADYLGIKPQTLCSWRCTRRYNLPFIKVGRLVRYRPEDVEAFLESRTMGARREG